MRRAIMEISPELLVEMCKDNPDPRYLRVVKNALPDDARCVGGYYDSIRDVFQIAIESEAFPDVPDHVKSPVLDPPVWKIVEVTP